MSMSTTVHFLETFANVQRNIHEWARGHGFWDEGEQRMTVDGCMGTEDVRVKTRPWNFGEKVALIHSELSEALEAHRKDPQAMDKHCPHHPAVAVELADAVIRILDLAEKLQIDLGQAILDKMAFNKTRPHKHGKAY